ncbi:GATOR complex protein Iml1-like [Oppia nitens]|uniref:GATOR complex protein Iml1-like n=1 Tax=Oppia nitens TaxID=1686743 RepID=UPI0023DBBCFB|nr:GATOR complex protein Iml1-like [Oppia nitens]
MKTYKLNVHKKDFFKEDLVINQKEFPQLKVGDIIEIFSPDDHFSRLLMRVNEKSFEENTRDGKENQKISIEQTIVSTFQLRYYCDVIVNKVDKKDAILDSVELFFKDQYIARSDMWRLKRHISKNCVYLNQKLEFCNIRCQVFEMWSQGERVASGYVTNQTKVVLRSSSSMVYLFLQMSSEMWDYDINGDLYFEKAVNGFLSDLFDKWKRFNCSHDVTIVMFSRTYFDAYSIEDFPESMQECLQQDSKGRFYEDYYRVAVQNERMYDWTQSLIFLRRLFNQYEEEVIKFHEKKGLRVPKAYNSSSSQGNFLEVLNMSLNVFERHHLDRSFDRTGQLSVVISPGVGVYEVDLDLTNITKQRIIDNGIGSDLVCLGEQPLHAVPLFKINTKFNTPAYANRSDVQYNMPHWINLSFYSSSKSISYSNFVPRIKLPNVLLKSNHQTKASNPHLYRSPSRESPSQLKSCQNIPFVDYDEYDSQVFRIASSPPNTSLNKLSNICQPSNRRNTVLSAQTNRPSKTCRRASQVYTCDEISICTTTPPNSPTKSESMEIPIVSSYRTELNHIHGYFTHLSTSVENKSIKDFKSKPESKDDLMVRGYSTSQKKDHLKSKALINPFDPSHVTIKLNSNRRRWTHVFPLGPTGIFMQQHHYQAVPQNQACTLLPSAACADTSLMMSDSKDMTDGQSCRKISTVQMKSSEYTWNTLDKKSTLKTLTNNSNLNESYKTSKSSQIRTTSIGLSNELFKNLSSIHSDRSLLWAWGATGEQEWTPAIITGVDWKSLVMPACLPITTDFLPDKRTLQQDYVTYCYNLLPEEQSEHRLQQRCYRGEEDTKYHQPLTTIQVYLELVCQRLQQGFQIILLPNSTKSDKSKFNNRFDKYEYALSIGRIFHELKLDDKTIYVTCYHPRHPYPVIKIHYCYRIRTPDNETYGVSWVDFTSEKLENYKWNYLDNYTCQKADEHELKENLKYWRFRLLMLPSMQSITKTIIEKYLSGEDEYPCDLYHDFTAEEKIQLQEGFIKFLEIINRIRRPANTRRPIIRSDNRKTINTQTTNRRFSSSSLQSQTNQTQTTRMSQPLDIAINETLLLKDNQKLKNLNISDCDEVDGGVVSIVTCKSPIVETDLTSNKESFESNEITKRLNIQSNHLEIIEAMKKSNAINFLTKCGGLPPFTFISAEAVFWAKDNIENVLTEGIAISLFQSLIESGLIYHSSGDKKQHFKYGFYLYCLSDANSEKSLFVNECDIHMFEKEYMEVSIVPQSNIAKNFEHWYSNTTELSNNSLSPEVQDFTFKNTVLDLDDGSKNGRVEWVNIKYHSVYDPEQAFEMIIEWMVSTGNSISEIVMGWSRKASSTGLHLVPIPADPFALPFSSKSDPLRGPIYITLNLDTLPKMATKLLEGEGLFNFQERILVKFGFIPFHDPSTDNQRQFVHVSGSIFVMIPSKNPASSPYKSVRKRGKFVKVDNNDMACSPHEEYITRHFSGVKQAGESAHIETKIGFLWCWNYMITKRWKTGVTGDENSMRKIMQDFCAFCSNKNQRLNQFWENYYTKENDNIVNFNN